jgi:hypothetical protein
MHALAQLTSALIISLNPGLFQQNKINGAGQSAEFCLGPLVPKKLISLGGGGGVRGRGGDGEGYSLLLSHWLIRVKKEKTQTE